MPPKKRTLSKRGRGKFLPFPKERAKTTEVEQPDERPLSPNPSVASSNVQDQDDSSSFSEAEDLTKKPRRSPRKRREKEHAGLTATQEDELFEWLKANPVLYSRGKAVKQIKDIWYKSVRSRVGRLVTRKSGDSQLDTESWSDRDKYLVDKMQFLVPHIHKVVWRPTVSVS
jgi:hypothetical protein